MDKRLLSLIERAERVIQERLEVSADLKEIFSEAKSAGYDVRTIKAVIRERAMDAAEREEREALLETYRAALGMPGATYRSVAEQLGVSKSKLQRLVPSEKRRDMGQTETPDAGPAGDDARTDVPSIPAEVVSNSSSGGMGENTPVAHAEGVVDAPSFVQPADSLDPRTFDEIVGERPAFLNRVKAA